MSLEEKRIDAEIDARRQELAIREKELGMRRQEAEYARRNRFSASSTALIAGAFSILSVLITTLVGGYQSHREQVSENAAELLLKKQEHEFQIVIRVTEDRTLEEAAQNLLFFVDVGYLPDPNGKIREKAEAGEVPTITSPPAGPASYGQAIGPRGEPISYLVDQQGRIQFEGSWREDNIISVEIPQLKGVPGAPKSGLILFHRAAEKDLKAAFSEIEREGLLGLILSWDGSLVTRTTRGSSARLSDHAIGTAFDINARWNSVGRVPVKGSEGSVELLVPVFERHGFEWGGERAVRPDSMHFQWVAD